MHGNIIWSVYLVQETYDFGKIIAWISVTILVDWSMSMAVVIYMNAYIHTDMQGVFKGIVGIIKWSCLFIHSINEFWHVCELRG